MKKEVYHEYKGERYYGWEIKGVYKTSGYMALKKRYEAQILSVNTAKLTSVYMNNISSLKDILININH